MLRSVVTIILIPCLLLNQSASLAHSHGEYTGEKHSARAHIHLSVNGSAADHDHTQHGHSHYGHKHTHSHSTKHHAESKTLTKADTKAFLKSPFEHDADCVYLVDMVASGPERTIGKGLQLELLQCFLLTPGQCAVRQLRVDKYSDWPPPILSGGCPLFLRHLSLLI